MAMQEAPPYHLPTIGGSLLHVLENDTGRNRGPGESENDASINTRHLRGLSHENTTNHPALLLHTTNNNHGGSCIHEQKTNHNRKRRRCILLCGPEKSGKSSLAMDIAYSKTSMAPPCLCLDTNMCRCTTVTMYMPVAVPPASAKAATSDEEEFPLSCRRVGMEEATEDPSKGGRYQDWNPHILKRIRIHRVASVRELLVDLLGMLGKPLQEQPRLGGAIIIDDLDTIVMRDPNIGRVSGNYGNGHRSATTTAILQTIAVASDTALALESLRIGTSTVGNPISVVATTKDVRMVLSPCIDTIVTLRHIPGDIDSTQWTIPSLQNQDKKDSEVGDNITVCSLWQAEIRSSLYSSPELMEEQISIVDYAIVESETKFGDKELRWKSGGTRLGV